MLLLPPLVLVRLLLTLLLRRFLIARATTAPVAMTATGMRKRFFMSNPPVVG